MNKTIVSLLVCACMFSFISVYAEQQMLQLPDKYAMTEYASITKKINDFTVIYEKLKKSKKRRDKDKAQKYETKIKQLQQELTRKLAQKEQEIKNEITKYEGKIKTDRANAKTYKIFIADLNTDLLRLQAFKQGKDFDPANPNPPPEPADAPKGEK